MTYMLSWQFIDIFSNKLEFYSVKNEHSSQLVMQNPITYFSMIYILRRPFAVRISGQYVLV